MSSRCRRTLERNSVPASERVSGLDPSGAAVGAVYDRTFFLESTNHARSQTAPTAVANPAELKSLTPRLTRGAALACCLVVVCVFTSSCATQASHPPRELRVCADPNNLPFSNARGQGFENRIAQIIAADLRASVKYTWWAQRRGFIRNTLKAGECDIVLGFPSSMDMALTTKPYYRSSYVFVSRADRRLKIASLNDQVLRKLRIGVQVVGDDYAATPAAEALLRRKLGRNLVGFSIYGDYGRDSPPKEIIEAVAAGNVDVAIVWGPLAGYYAKHSSIPLETRPVIPSIDLPFLPFVYDIAIGVRSEDTDLRDELESVLDRRENDIKKILDEYGVPRV
jgi:mxaJ protein